MSGEGKQNKNTKADSPGMFAKFKGLKLWKKIALAVVAFFVALFVIVYVATSGPAKASDSFVNSILSNDPKSAYSLFSSDAKEIVSEEQFTEVVNKMSEILADSAKQTSKGVEGKSGQAARGTVKYEIEGSDGTYELTVNLIKEDGEWKVLNFNNSLKK